MVAHIAAMRQPTLAERLGLPKPDTARSKTSGPCLALTVYVTGAPQSSEAVMPPHVHVIFWYVMSNWAFWSVWT